MLDCKGHEYEPTSFSATRSIINLTGEKYGKLTVIEQVKCLTIRGAWLCRCACGNFVCYSGSEDTFYILQSHDRLKNNYVRANNISLVRIPYYISSIALEGIFSDKYIVGGTMDD